MTGNQEIIRTLDQIVELVVQYGLEVLGAFVLLVGGWLLSNFVKRNILRLLDRSTRLDATLKPVLANLVRYTILGFVLIAVLAQFGVQTASIIAMLGAAGLAIGLALQGALQNIAAGIMLLFLRPFRVGDYIDAEGVAGSIDEIGLFTTQMHTFDGIYLEVPNAQLWNRAIKNFSRRPTRRLDVSVGIGYRDDIDKALAVLMDLLEKDARVHGDPAPEVMVTELADSAVNLNLRCWTSSGDYWPLHFDLAKGVKQRLDEAGISIPYPQRDVHLHQVKET